MHYDQLKLIEHKMNFNFKQRFITKKRLQHAWLENAACANELVCKGLKIEWKRINLFKTALLFCMNMIHE